MSYPPIGYGTYPPPPPAPSGSTGRTVRSIIAWVALALAALLTVPAVVAYWAHGTIGNQDAYVAAVAPVGTDPQVKEIVSQEVGNAVTERLQLGALGVAIGNVVRGLVTQAMATKVYENAWADGNAAVQQQIVGALSGTESGVSVSGNDVMLDLAPMLDGIKDGLVSQGLGVAANLEVPKGELQIRLMDAATLDRLQTMYRLSSPFAGWGVYLVAALYLLALLIAPKRGPILVVTGLALAIGGALVVGVIALWEASFRSQLSGQPFAPAAQAYASALSAPLQQWWPPMVALGGALAVIGAIWWVVSARRS